MDENKRVAVVILNWNGEKLLSEYLPSVAKYTNNEIADVIVADNGSTDGSVELLKAEFPGVRLIEFEENYGFAEGYNRVIALIADEYEYSVLLNSDVKVDDDWLTPLYEFMVSHPDAGAAQPKIKSVIEPDKFEYAGASGGFLDCNGYPYCRGRIFDTVETDRGQYEKPIKVDWASGAVLMVVNKLYLEVGGLDKKFFAHMEEIDLCWRILLAGKEVWAVPSSHVYHLGGGSLPASDPKKTYLNFRNNLLMLHKNLPDRVRKRRLFNRRLLDTVAWAKFVLTGDFKNASAIFRAHRDFAKMRGEYNRHPKVDLLKGHTNILVDYYIRARRTYDTLKN
ncbi:MAG: glycosyltransferase family 2 protein [Duncaniella sp.]|nr:glycosyltransferase family 2 protein [Muribaculum sp.]MCM1255643.1 glycosyltransferase family 2 protein [Duncaniella sp.]